MEWKNFKDEMPKEGELILSIHKDYGVIISFFSSSVLKYGKETKWKSYPKYDPEVVLGDILEETQKLNMCSE